MKMYALSEDLRAALHNYLLSRPMGEVEGLVSALRQLPELQVQDKEGKPKEVDEISKAPKAPKEPKK